VRRVLIVGDVIGDEAAMSRAITMALDVWKLSRELTAVP
jgi:hypothetical protein